MGLNQRAAIVMSNEEVAAFLAESRIANVATVGPVGQPHLVAMWYGLLDGKIYLETKAKSQKVINLRRDPRITALIEAGDSYDQLRGVSIEGTAAIIDDPAADEFWAVAVSMWERYNGPYTKEARPLIEESVKKRAMIRIDPVRMRSWDHRTLGLAPTPVSGSTVSGATVG
jgi:PPOX class probable F420-dependent enzyme